MIYEIKRRLYAGEIVELECIDRQSFTDPAPRDNTEILKQDSLTVSHIDMYDRVHLKGELSGWYNYISPEELKFFKIKEEGDDAVIDNTSKAQSFDGLVEVAIQAVKDGVIESIDFHKDLLIIYISKSGYTYDKPSFSVSRDDDIAEIPSIIEKIDSLYVESFEIESEEDCFKIKQGAEITFTNGNSVIMDNPPTDDGIVRIWNDGRYDFTVLQGATVTQRKSKK